MKYTRQQLGFSAVELLITLFIASIFLITGFQLYALVISDGGETLALNRAGNKANEYLQQYKASATKPCTTQNPITNQSVTVTGLSNVTYSVAISCPYAATTSLSKVLVTLKYGTPQKVISNATYVKP